eukprot:13332873-Alexandrium_andersonii.AAC.1
MRPHRNEPDNRNTRGKGKTVKPRARLGRRAEEFPITLMHISTHDPAHHQLEAFQFLHDRSFSAASAYTESAAAMETSEGKIKLKPRSA